MMRLALAIVCAALAGCASGGPIMHSMPDKMDGLFVDVQVDKPPDSSALYSVTKDGKISFAGGTDVRRRTMTWSDDLTDEERAKVIAMIESFGWLRSGPTSSPTNPEDVYSIAVRRRSERMSCVVHGDNPQVLEMVSYLDQICRRRFDEFMQSLPQPSQPGN